LVQVWSEGTGAVGSMDQFSFVGISIPGLSAKKLPFVDIEF
jgi:hypothetical protein